MVEEDWLVTFADAITLLMAFFVLILTFSEVNQSTFEQVQASMAREIGHRSVEQPLNLFSLNLKKLSSDVKLDDEITVDMSSQGILIDLSSEALFDAGSAELKSRALPFFNGLADMLLIPVYQEYNIEVEGHTDDVPISTPAFPSNWELSAARAASVARYLIQHRVKAPRFTVSGYADIKPKVANKDMSGEALPENRALNRRIVVHLKVPD